MPLRGRGRLLALRWFWPLPRLVADLCALAFVAWEGVQGRYSAASHAGILAAIAVVLLLGMLTGRGRQRKRSGAWLGDAARAVRTMFAEGRVGTPGARGALVWVLLIAATIGWDMTSFVEQQHSLPTLSRLFGAVTDHDWGRALLFAAWLVLGLYLALGRRLPRKGSGGPPRASTGRIGPRPSEARWSGKEPS
jgi:hypothetical protein